MKQPIVIIGAGMVGTACAWHLVKSGEKVVLLDRKAPGAETSYGNAGLIQREAVHLVPFPRQVSELARLSTNRASDIRYTWAGMRTYARPLFRYWRQSAPQRLHQAESEWAQLIEHCTHEHGYMAAQAGAEHLFNKNGWLQLHHDAASLNYGIARARRAQRHGVEYAVLTAADVERLEPDIRMQGFAGAIHWQNSWQVVNPGHLVRAYADDFVRMGGELQQKHVTHLTPQTDGWRVHAAAGDVSAAQVVVATGPWSNQLLQPLGYRFPLFPMRGYHQHFAPGAGVHLGRPFVDFDRGFVVGNMDMGVRITSGAEMTTLDAPQRLNQLQLVSTLAKAIIDLGDARGAPWHGARPCMADMKPVIGAAHKHQHLWLAFGHGHQGFTLGAVTGRLLESLMHARTPWLDATPFASARFA